MKWIRVLKLVWLSGLLTLAGCLLTSPTPSAGIKLLSAAPFCDVALPIFYSKNDTEYTKQQVREHNSVGVKLCGWTVQPN